MHQFRSVTYLIIAVINVVVSVILCNFFGIIGVAIGTAVADFVGCGIIRYIYFHKKIGLNIIKFWKSILKASLGLIIPIIFGILITVTYSFNSKTIYIILIAMYTLVYIIFIYIVWF